MEDEVMQVLGRMENNPIIKCNCDKCKLDIAAIALNSLSPNYVVTKYGYVYAKAKNLNYQFNIDVIMAVTKAIEIVGKSPKHDI